MGLCLAQATPDFHPHTIVTHLLLGGNLPTFAVDYRRCLTRMARDAHQQWRLIYLWLGF